LTLRGAQNSESHRSVAEISADDFKRRRVPALRVRDLHPQLLQRALAEVAIALEPIAELPAADDVKSLPPQLVLDRAVAEAFKEDETVVSRLANPGQLRAPILDAVHQPGENIAGRGVRDMHAHFRARAREAQIHVAQIVRFTDAEDAKGTGGGWPAGLLNARTTPPLLRPLSPCRRATLLATESSYRDSNACSISSMRIS
jgi:hypothetical protein